MHSRISCKMLKITCKMFIVLSLWFLLANKITNAGRILVIIPTPLYSHQIVFQSLCLALNRRGHELIVTTPQLIKDSTLNTNYTEIKLPGFHSLVKQYKEQIPQLLLIDLFKRGWMLTHQFSTQIFDNPKFKKLYHSNSNEKFDAVILELLGYPSLSIMSYRFNAPLIGKMISVGDVYKIACK